MVKRLQTQPGPKTVMITWLLLACLSCESLQDKNEKENLVPQCGPQNLKLTSSVWTILATWEDEPSCSAVRDMLIYEVVVLSDQGVFNDEVVVMPERIGSTHSWNWTSSLALECVSHTVKIRSRYKNTTSPWIQGNLPGRRASSRMEIYPQDELFAVNSTVTFCCIMPDDEMLGRMYLDRYDSARMSTTKINRNTYVLTALLDQPSKKTCTNVICSSPEFLNGACVWISYPPTDRDLQCETRDLESVDCYWMVGKETDLPKRKISTKYQLNGRNCSHGSEKRCSLRVEDGAGERKWTLTAQNELGKVELTDTADLMKRVHMFAPVRVSAAVNAWNATLLWDWEVQRYRTLDITCRINISHGDTSAMTEASGVGLHSAVVVDLTPNWDYDVTIQCGTTQHLWKWSNKSTRFNFTTNGDVPDAVDVWMQMKDNQTFIVWKELQADQSHGNILGFKVTCAKSREQDLQNIILTEHSSRNVSLHLDPNEEYNISVMAWNKHGFSTPSTIIIPRLEPDRSSLNTSRIRSSNGGFNLSWSASPAASCGYIVDWRPTSGSCRVDWMKVSPNQTDARIVSNFRDGQRYVLSVYACTEAAPELLERREGYIKEQRLKKDIFKSLKWRQHGSNVEVSWEPVPLRSRSAFIVGYVLYCEDNNNNNKKIVCNVSTDNPEATSLTATNLKINTYVFTVKVKTAAGESGDSSITATLNPLTDNLIEVITISFVSVFGLLSLITILCYRSWSCIRHKVYPPIPKPVLTDKWLTTGENSHHLHVDQYFHSEADIMDVPDLQSKQGAPVNDYVIQGNLPYVSAQPLKSYYNQSVKNCNPQPLSSFTTAVSPQSGSPSSPFKSLIPNSSYSLTMEMEYQPCSLNPKPEEEKHPEVHCDGYQPQLQTANPSINQTEECTDSPMSCVFTYVLLPQ